MAKRALEHEGDRGGTDTESKEEDCVEDCAWRYKNAKRMLPIDENGNVDGWTRSSNRSEREKRVMTPIQFRAASSAHISSHSRELLFAKHARLESREKRELRSKKVELERDLRAALAARDRLVERLEDSETSLCEAEEQIRILKATEQVHVLANKNMANELEEERASAFDDQVREYTRIHECTHIEELLLSCA